MFGSRLRVVFSLSVDTLLDSDLIQAGIKVSVCVFVSEREDQLEPCHMLRGNQMLNSGRECSSPFGGRCRDRQLDFISASVGQLRSCWSLPIPDESADIISSSLT